MRVVTVDPAVFEARAVLGLLGTLRRHPTLYPDHELWLVEDAGEVLGAALRTRPQRLVLAEPAQPEAVAALAAAIDEDLPGVVGAVPEVEWFARAWEERRDARASTSMAQGLYELERLLPSPTPPGKARAATASDRPLLEAWLHAFGREALRDARLEGERLSRLIDHRLVAEDAGFLLWELDGRPVALAGYGGETPNGVRIGPVYTPPALRGRGFGTAVTAAVTADRLRAGRRFCFLYTDLSNPVSNQIYVRLGYRRVCDSLELDFVPAQPGKEIAARAQRSAAPE